MKRFEALVIPNLESILKSNSEILWVKWKLIMGESLRSITMLGDMEETFFVLESTNFEQ